MTINRREETPKNESIGAGFCLRLARRFTRYEVEDLAQDLEIRAWELREKPTPYVKRCLYNYATDWWRKRKIRIKWVIPVESLPETVVFSPETSVSLLKWRLSGKCVGKAGRAKKRVVALVFGGCTMREISQELKVSRSQAHRLVVWVKGKVREEI